MDIESLAKELILKNMNSEQQLAVLEGIKASVAQAKEVQKQRIGENVGLVVDALKKIESDIRSRYDEVGNAIEKRVASIKDGKDGKDGRDGRNGKDGRDGKQGVQGVKGEDGRDGRDGVDGVDGVSVTSARIDFDGSLIISLSSGIELNVGEVVAPDLAERIKVITNGGGTSQSVLDTLDSLQTQINNLIPSQTGNSGKFLTTNGTSTSWASVAGGLSYQGTWNASTNTPTLASGVGTNGYYYIVATAGSTNLDGITDWQIGDWLMFNGTVWQKIDQSNLVTSVNGQTGAVTLITTNVSEGTNLYYTDARARASLSGGTGISYNSSTGAITNSAPDQTVALTSGVGISTSGTYPNFTITNSAPDQTVALTGAGTTSISGTYPNFTITSNDQYQGTVTSVSGSSPVASSGGATPAISLASGYGDTQNPYASKTANYFLAAPNGASGVPTFRAVVAADIPTLNQNTTGTASNVTGTVAIANGGTGLTSFTANQIHYGSFSTSVNLSFDGTTLTANNITSAASTALTLKSAGTTAVTIDTSQNVGIGTSSPASKLDINTGSSTGTTDMITLGGLDNASTKQTYGVIQMGIENNTASSEQGNILLQTVESGTVRTRININGSGYQAFSNGGSERMRIDSSGNLLVGTTSAVLSGKITSSFAGNAINGATFNDSTSASGSGFVIFSISGTAIGNISRVASTSAVAYNTTSDQRLKSNITDSQSVIDKLMAVKVRQYDWTEGQLHQDYGFIAQEIEPVLSGIVTKGKTEEDMWQLDYAKLTPHLVKAIQELKAINDTQAETINALTARVVALEGQ